MGAWDAGIFDNDAALDLVASISDEVKKEMVAPSCVEDEEQIMAAVSIQKTLIEHCHAPHPDRNEIVALRDNLLAVYDAEIDGLDSGPEFKMERRRVIEQTFDDFLNLLKD